jgi:short-subunit dehydrogenase
MADRDLKGKVIVLTGASSGFGKGAAREFALRGAFLVLAARRDELLEELAKECETTGGKARAVTTDVSQSSEVENLAQAALTEFGRIDIWINNAGVSALGRFDEVPLEDHVKVVETDLLGTLYGSYFALQQFRKQGQGILINVASIVGKVPAPYYSSYVAAKHGVVGLSASLRQELAENDAKDIRICTILPTSFDTPFFDHSANYLGRETEPIPPVYAPGRVIEVMVRLATDPEDEVTVGSAAKVMTLAHQIAPGLTEALMGKQVHKAHVEKADPAPETPGSVQEPLLEGTEVKRTA